MGGGSGWDYPFTRRDESVVEDHHGTKVADPYRWLEDPDSLETQEWVEEQNKLSRSYVSQGDVRGRMLEKLKTMNEYDKIGCPFRAGDKIFYFQKKGSQNQSVLYSQADLNTEAEVVLDPNLFSEDGTAALGEIETSDDSRYLAYTVSLSGSDWRTIRVRDLSTGKDLAGDCDWARYTSIAWKKDGSGFYYCRYPEIDSEKDLEDRGKSTTEVKHHMIYFHQVGKAQSEDRLVYRDEDHPDWNVGVEMSDDGQYLMILVSRSCAPQSQVKIVDVSRHFGTEGEGIVTVVDDFTADYRYVANDGPVLYLKTNRGAPKNRILKVDLDNLKHPDQWDEVLAEHETDVLVSVSATDLDKMLIVYQRDVKHILELHELGSGRLLREIPLPDLGCVDVQSKRRHSNFFYRFTSFSHPGSIFCMDLAMSKEPVLFKQVVVPDHEPNDYVADQIFFSSKDGTRVPMFVVRKRSVSYPAPCCLYGYGGFMISITPHFSLSALAWMRFFDGVYVVANIRGGDEYGESWHNAGIQEKKQNVFDDFQAAAEALVSEGITVKEKLWILGGSNGGLLVGACVNQRPELFGAAVAQVGVMDMLRFHKFGIGRFWISDFGDPDNAKMFPYIYAYSPLHTVRDPSKPETPYPPVMLMTADHDDRVAPLHSLKYAAELQHRAGSCTEQQAPLLLLVDTKAGHGAGKPTTKVLEEAADRFAFIARAIDCKLVD